MSQPAASKLILLVSGPSGSGKSTLVEHLLRRHQQLEFSVSYTTRPIRAGEQEGREYHFVDTTTFRGMIDQGGFAEHAEVHGNLYGTWRPDLVAILGRGHHPLLDLDVQGGCRLLDALGGDVVSVFVFPPSWAELERRLRGRGTDPEATIQRRLQNARWEIGFASRYEYFVVNETREQACADLESILRAEQLRKERWIQPPLSP